MATPILKEVYKGFEINRLTGTFYGYSDYFFISKNGERVSQMALNSIKACKTIIDTHERNKIANQYPIYR